MNMRAIEHNLRLGLSLPTPDRDRYISGAKQILEDAIPRTSKENEPEKYVLLNYLLAQLIVM